MIEVSDQISILKEFKRRQEHNINQYIPSNLSNHNQESYHRSKSRVRLLFGGNQSGKSHAAAFDCACNARGRNPFNEDQITGRDIEIWIIAPEYSLIQHGMYRHLKDIIPDWDIISEGPKVPGHRIPSYIIVRRKDGFKTIIELMSTKGEAREKFQAAAVDYFYIDEEIPPAIWEELEARTLKTGGKFSISATLVESYDWILDLERMGEDKHNDSVFLTRLNTELNPYLDKETVSYLKNKWSQETREYRLYGKARIVKGLIYNRFDSEHICDPFNIPYDWPRWFAMDPGIRTCAALWVAVGPDDTAYAYRELYAHNEPLWDIASEVKKLEGYKLNQSLSLQFDHWVWEETEKSEKMVSRVIDPKSRARSEAGEESIISQLSARYGILCAPGDNSLRAGIEDCRFWLERKKFKVFDTLENFLEEIRCYRVRPAKSKRDQNETIDDPVRRKNHLMDCWRYIARERPTWKDRRRLANVKPSMSTADRIRRKLRNDSERFHEIVGEW